MMREFTSNIKKRDLLLNPTNYLWLEVSEDYSNTNFMHLLEFIEEYSDYGKDSRYGNAYYIIRKTSNELFGVGRYSPVKLKISKREIKSIRSSVMCYYNGKKYIKIPYKISYIFKALILIVEEIEKKNNIGLPDKLSTVINLTYRIGFYEKQVEIYDSYFEEIRENNLTKEGYRLKVELNNDFHSEGSIFNTIIQ